MDASEIRISCQCNFGCPAVYFFTSLNLLIISGIRKSFSEEDLQTDLLYFLRQNIHTFSSLFGVIPLSQEK